MPPLPPDIEIRPMRGAEQKAVAELWAAAGVARPWNDPARDIEFARRGPHSTILVAAGADTVLASVMIGEDGHRGWVYYLAAEPARQRTGLGRAMMDAAEAWLAARGVWKIQLLVRDDNEAARGFYERLGYRDTRSTCLQKIIG